MQNFENMFVESKAFVPADANREDSFSSFLSKSVDSQFNGSITLHDITSIFPKVNKYNVLRQYCLHVLTDSSSVEVPSTRDVVLSTDDENRRNNKNSSKPISIQLSDEYAKWLLPRSLFYKIEGYHEYLKSVFSDGIAALEKKIFVDGNNSGILALLRSEDRYENDRLEYNGEVELSAEKLLNLKFKLKERYRRDAIFMMSSSSLQKISSEKDTNGRYIFDGVDRIFGHKVEVVDELGDVVLFSDFKQSTVLAERLNPKIEMHSGFDNPSSVGLSLPISVGVGIINHDAIVCEIFKNNSSVHASVSEEN